MKSVSIKWVVLIAGFVLYSCTKVVDINLNDSSPQVVIEGNVTNAPGPYYVRVIKTVNFSDDNIYPPVTGATVKITDDTNTVSDMLTETSPGVYATNTLQGIPGHSYQLYVLADGQTYTASSVMPQPVPLDSVTFQHLNIFGSTNINAVANFKDPAGVSNYYSFIQWVNGRRLENTFVFDDRLSDGKYISQQIFTDSTYISAGNTIMLQMNCLDKSAYNYFNTLGQVTGGGDFSPANPVSNISNNALGYFSAHTVQTKTVIAY